MQICHSVTLRTDVYRPDAPGRLSVLLSRRRDNRHLRPSPGLFGVHGLVTQVWQS
jgi:hypothetical protein